jgi:hypothetical protein
VETFQASFKAIGKALNERAREKLGKTIVAWQSFLLRELSGEEKLPKSLAIERERKFPCNGL